MSRTYKVACPFTKCDGPVEALVEMPPPLNNNPGVPLPLDARFLWAAAHGPITRILAHGVIGDGAWFGRCPASLMAIPLSNAAKELLRNEATTFTNWQRERDENAGAPSGPVDSSGSPIVEGSPRQPAPWDLGGNGLPPGNVADRVWEKVTCGVCGGWIVRVPSGWRHQRSDGTEWNPFDQHAATPVKDEERIAASDRGKCTWPGCGRPIIRTARGWEHRNGQPYDNHHPTP